MVDFRRPRARGGGCQREKRVYGFFPGRKIRILFSLVMVIDFFSTVQCTRVNTLDKILKYISFSPFKEPIFLKNKLHDSSIVSLKEFLAKYKKQSS
ncbi:hypothetical protein YC2023_114813 [Brassica napus]